MRGLGQMKIEQRQIEAKKARVWYASLRLWMWRWQTLSQEDRAVFYKQQKFGITHSKIKHFDAPYLLTMSAENGGWVYQRLPASMHGHRVNIVYNDIEINPDGSEVKFPSGHFHCVDCKLMGTENTMKEYSCLPPKSSLLMHYRRDYYIPTEEDLDKYMAIRTEAGWWKRKSIQDEAGRYSLERKWIKPR